MASIAEIAILIKAQDKASGPMEKIAKKLGLIDSAAGRAGGSLGKLAAAAGIGAFGALAGGIAFAAKEAMDAQKVQAQLNAVLESTGHAAGVSAAAANDLASALQKVTPFSDEAVLSAENMLLTFTNLKANVFPQATEAVLNMSTALGQDLQSSAIQLGKALNDPIGGVTALRRVGVQLTDAQEDQVKAFVRSGDALSAQKVILKELETEFGNSARAAGQTFPGQLAIMRNALSDVAESIGNRLLPGMTAATEGLTQFLQEHQADIDNFVDAIGVQVPAAFDAVKDAIQPVIDVLEPFASALNAGDIATIALAIGGGLTAAFVAVTVAATAAFVAENAAPLGIPIAAAAAVAGIVLLVRHWNEVVGAFKAAPSALLDWLENNWGEALVAVLTGPLGLAVKHWDDIWGVMPGLVQDAMNVVAGIVSKTVNFIIDALNALTDKINSIGDIGGIIGLDVPDIPKIPGVGDFQLHSGPNTDIVDSWQAFNEGQAASIGAGWKAAAKALGVVRPELDATAYALSGGGGGGGGVAGAASQATEDLNALAAAFAEWSNTYGSTDVEGFKVFSQAQQELADEVLKTGEASNRAAVDLTKLGIVLGEQGITGEAFVAMRGLQSLSDAFQTFGGTLEEFMDTLYGHSAGFRQSAQERANKTGETIYPYHYDENKTPGKSGGGAVKDPSKIPPDAIADPPIEPEKWKFPSMATGTPYVRDDGLVYLHRGEAVIPAAQNRRGETGPRTITFNNFGHISYPDASDNFARTLATVLR